MSKSKRTYTEADSAIFPPYMSRFILVVMLLIFSHTAFMISFGLYVLEVHVGAMLVGGLISALFLIFCNIAITRGHDRFVKVLKIIAWMYLTFGLLTILFKLLNMFAVPFELSGILILFAGIALVTMHSVSYRVCVKFVKDRWDIYRETGETVVEAMAKK